MAVGSYDTYDNEKTSKLWIVESPGTGDTSSFETSKNKASDREATQRMIVFKPALGISGTLAGVGEEANIEFLLKALAAAKEAGELPQRLSLKGYSRGAVQNIELANRIYELYGDQIKINMTLTDPVPGPNRGYGNNKIGIPPNVDSVIAVYFHNETKPGFKAQDFGSRIVAYDTDKTTITTFGLPMTHTDDYKNQVDISKCRAAEKAISENIKAVEAGMKPTTGMPYSYYDKDKGKEVQDTVKLDPNEMLGKGSRKACNFAMVTPINANLPEEIKEQHKLAREIFTQIPAETIKQMPEHILAMKQDTLEARRAYKQAMIDHGKNIDVNNNSRTKITKEEVLAVALHVVTLGLSTLIHELNDQHRTRSKGFTIGLSLITLGILPLAERITKMVEKLTKGFDQGSPVPTPPEKKCSSGSILDVLSSRSGKDTGEQELVDSLLNGPPSSSEPRI